ncbi:MAG: methyltransferase [Proteobacteria bacterium]|nr:methyltransferase [Pseudomonadota bacterium]
MKQYLSGYRYTIDPVLLAHFVRPGSKDRVMDLGTGAGIIPAILSHRYPGLTICGIEIQARLAKLALSNIQENDLAHGVSIICGDMTQPSVFPTSGDMDFVLSNPPYIPHRAGRLNPSDEKAIARHEVKITLRQLILTAVSLLKDKGHFAVIYPQNRLVDLLIEMRAAGLEPRTLQMVQPHSGGTVKRVLVESVKGGKPDLTILKTLSIYQRPGIYSDEIKDMFR